MEKTVIGSYPSSATPDGPRPKAWEMEDTNASAKSKRSDWRPRRRRLPGAMREACFPRIRSIAILSRDCTFKGIAFRVYIDSIYPDLDAQVALRTLMTVVVGQVNRTRKRNHNRKMPLSLHYWGTGVRNINTPNPTSKIIVLRSNKYRIQSRPLQSGLEQLPLSNRY